MTLYFLLRCLGLVLLGLLIYGQTFSFTFVFDDHLFIVTNPLIKNLSNFHLLWQGFPITRMVGMYSFALNYYFGQLSPRGYHIFNFIVHLLATGLVWALADLLFKITKGYENKDRLTKELPFIIAVIFLVHPCQTQAVTYITQRFESMATLFYLGTIYFYLRARLAKESVEKIILFGLGGLSCVLGVLTKEVIATVPVMIGACEWILFPKKDNKKIFIAVVLVGGLLALLFTKMLHAGASALFQTFPSESHDGDVLTPAHYFLTQLRVFLTFLRLLILPVHQNLDYDYPASTGLFHPPLTLVGLGVILGFIFLIIKLRRSTPLIAFGLAWILVTFSINLAPRSNVIFEHKLYLISFGFILVLVAALSRWVKDRKTLLKGLCCIIAILAFVTFERNKVWANELLLWEDIIKNSPNKSRVNANLGRVYGTLGRYDESIDYLTRAITLSPDNITYENRGTIYSEQGRNDLAMEDLNKSIAMAPNYFPTYVKRAWVYQKKHQYKEAFADLQHAVQLNMYFVDAYIARGMLWAELGRPMDALKDFQQALNIDPFNVEAAQYKSYCLTKLGIQPAGRH